MEAAKLVAKSVENVVDASRVSLSQHLTHSSSFYILGLPLDSTEGKEWNLPSVSVTESSIRNHFLEFILVKG